MTSHWPTYADGLFWCACDNRTFATQDEWQDHVVDAVLEEGRQEAIRSERRGAAALASLPVNEAVEQPQAGA